ADPPEFSRTAAGCRSNAGFVWPRTDRRRAIPSVGDSARQDRQRFPARETRFGRRGEKRARESPSRVLIAGQEARLNQRSIAHIRIDAASKATGIDSRSRRSTNSLDALPV